MKKQLFYIILLILIFLVPLILLPHLGQKQSTARQDIQVKFLSPEKFADSLHKFPPYKQQHTQVKGIVVPHHLLASVYIAQGLQSASSHAVTRVVLIGPNHNEKGQAKFQSIDARFLYPGGSYLTQSKVVAKLTSTGLVRLEPETFPAEHSIAGLIPFLAMYFPKAEVVPIVVKQNVDKTEVEAVAKELARLDNSRTVFVASVDFSHYLRSQQAEQNDQLTAEFLQTMDIAGILSLKGTSDYMDSPGSIALLFATLKKLNATHAEMLQHGNSEDIIGEPGGQVTSYFTVTYQ